MFWPNRQQILIALILLSFSNSAFAAELLERQTIQIKKINHPINIDGILDPNEWNDAARVDKFWQWSPKEGAQATEKTISSMAYDDKAIYFAFDVYDSSPSFIRATIAKREDIGEDDYVWISLDTFNDQRRGYEFICNPYGVQEDVFMTPSNWDPSFDTVWDCAGKLNDHGYSVEMRIPFRSLRFGKSDPQIWGLQLHRMIRRKGEHVSWSPYTSKHGHYFYQMGQMEGLTGIKTGRNIEILPEFTQSYIAPSDWKSNAGISFKYAPTPSNTFDATYHPDYSQVELDPVQLLVNLRFPVFIAEKRPFFLERADVFQTPLTLVHTRTITTPQFGAKWTGKEGGTTFGVLSANDEAPINGKATTNVLRLQQDLFKHSTIAMIYANRELGSYYNRVVGLDGRLHFWDIYTLSYQYVYTWERDLNQNHFESPGFTTSFSRSTRSTRISLAYTDLGENLRADTGFLPRVNVRNPSGTLAYVFWPEKDYLTNWGPTVSYSRIYDHSGMLTDDSMTISLDAGNPVLGVNFGYSPSNLVRFNNSNFYKNSGSLSLSASISEYWTGAISGSYGEEIHFSNPIELGNQSTINASLTLKPWPQLKMSPSYFRTELREKGTGQRLNSQDTVRYRIDYQWSLRLSTRLIEDYTRVTDVGYQSNVWTTSFLMSYIWHPATAIYVGYNRVDGRTAPAPYKRQSEQSFVKLSYLFRL